LKSLFFRLLTILLLPMAVFLAVVFYLAQPPRDNNPQTFTINKGDSLRSIAKKLEEEDLIKNQYIFTLLVSVRGLGGKMQAGRYELNGQQNVPALAETLTHGRQDLTITIQEGWRREQIAQYLSGFGVSQEEFLQNSIGLEGQLWPDTYLIPDSWDAAQIVEELNATYKENIGKLKTQNPKNTLILASIIEREGKLAVDKKLVASILTNRLNIGIPLQVDATVQYAKDSSHPPQKWNEWWDPITKGDLSFLSSYNTYLNSGLPPGPICNPSWDSLDAAATPILSDFLFYISDANGKIHPAETLEEQNQNINMYLK